MTGRRLLSAAISTLLVACSDQGGTSISETSAEPIHVRGQVVLGHEARTFTECDTNREGWLIDNTSGDLADHYQRLATDQYQPIFVEVVGTWTTPPESGFGAEYDDAIAITSLLRAEREGFGFNENLSGILFRARGNEPSWTLTVADSDLLFSTPGGASSSFMTPQIEFREDGVHVSAATDSDSMSIHIAPKRCTDSMSGSVFAFSATVRRGDTEYSGCAVVGSPDAN